MTPGESQGPPRTVHLVTLGCKVNQQDSAAMGELLSAQGWQVVSDPAAAPGGPDVILVNSCAVTGRAAAKSRQAARSLARRFPRSRVWLCGCYPQADPAAAARVSGVAAVAGTGRLATVAGLAAAAEPGGNGAPGGPDSFAAVAAFEALPAALGPDRVRAFLKVQDGCEAGCAYCVVPLVRGPERSLPVEAALGQARELLSRGARELVLTGIRLGRYDGLVELIRRCRGLPGLARLRLSSLEPGDVGPELLAAVAEGAPVVCPHLHLPLQSGSDRVLGAMGRDYTGPGYLDLVRRARSAVPGLAVSADAITGFPGETEADFQATVDLVRAAGFSRLHVFPYSARPGTRAAAMQGQVPVAVRQERARRLIAVGGECSLGYHRAWVGRPVEVLLESAGPDGRGGFRGDGLSPHYLRVEVAALGPEARPGDILCVNVVRATTSGLAGRQGHRMPWTPWPSGQEGPRHP